ncbi:hypothetical protein HY450_00605 [Candidatus Pacearchaeota archaeon]|nr:hypothetical protein [Candidatus Pacearchaeota archaeon]
MVERDYPLKMAVIAGASEAIKYKDKHPRAMTEEIIQYITEKKKMEEILKKVDKEEE